MRGRWNGKTFHCVAPIDLRCEQFKRRDIYFWCKACSRESKLEVSTKIGSFAGLRTEIKWFKAHCVFCEAICMVDLRQEMD
jgi:hypothetical protein